MLTKSDVEMQKKLVGDSLAKCIERINENHQIAVECDRLCVENGRRAIQAVIVAGKNLMSAKVMVEKGKWQEWVEKNCPAISIETVKRYIRLAKRSHVTDLSGCDTLRQAYIATGILKEKEKPEKKSSEPVLPYSQRLCFKLIKELHELEDVNDPEQIEQILPTMETIVRWYLNHASREAEIFRELDKYFSSALTPA